MSLSKFHFAIPNRPADAAKWAVIAGSVFLTGYWVFNSIKTAWFSPLLQVPGLPYGPLYGNIKEAMIGEAMDSSVRWVKKYGGVVRFYHFFGRESLLVADPDAIRHVLVTNGKNYPRNSSGVIRDTVPEGLFSLEGDIHWTERKLLNPSFNLASVKSCMGLFNCKGTELVSKFNQLLEDNEGATINIQRYAKAATMDVIGLTAFDFDLRAIQDPENNYVESINILTSSDRFSLLIRLPFYKYLPTPANKKLWEATRIVDNLCSQIIRRRRAQADKTEGSANIMGRLIEARYENSDKGLSDKAIRDNILTFMIAGHETSSYTLTWLLYELARNPDIQQRLYNEVSENTGSVTDEDLSSYPYLSACLQEILRLYPAASSLLRKSVADDVINGYPVPAGTDVIVHLGAMMRTCVEDGECFKPERFLNDSMTKKWLPFGIGSHACLGNKFALSEMKVLMVHLLRNFQFMPVEGLKIRRKYRIVLRPVPEVCLVVKARQ